MIERKPHKNIQYFFLKNYKLLNKKIEMKKKTLLLLTLFLAINLYSQVEFEKGYYIDNFNKKIECLIKNIGWKYSPNEFDYKFSKESEKEESINIKNAKEFGIYGKYKFIRKVVNIDQSSTKLKELSNERKPNFKEKKVFLKVLIEGKASLFSYRELYFYSIHNLKIEPLVFKEYYNKYKQIFKNNDYKNQLLKDLECTSITVNKLENLNYKKRELVNLFIAYNQCKNEIFENFTKKQKSDLFNLNIRPGLNSYSLSIGNDRTITRDVDFDTEIGYRFGVEFEFIMGLHKNKWALIIEPTYQNYKSEKTISAFFDTQNVTVDYKSIEVPIGLRHYLFLNKNSKFFVNASFVIDFNNKKSVINFEKNSNLDIKTAHNLALGIGYKQNDKYSLEFRYHTPRNLLKNSSYFENDFNTLSFIFGYTIF